MNTQDQPQHLSPLSHLEDRESNKDSKIHPQQEENLLMGIDLTPQMPSRSPFDEIQTTPNYTPMIPMARDINKVNLVTNNANDDETPFQGVLKQDGKTTSTAHQGEKYKIPPTSIQKSSLQNAMKSKIACSFEESKVRIFLGSFILILMLVNLAILIPFTVYFSRKKDIGFEAVNGALSYIAFSVDADPILDIQAHNAGSSCPQDYHRLVLGIWPGTTDGCECSTYLRKGECVRSGRGATEGSCDDIDSISPINMYDWGGEEWCVLKAKPEKQYKKAVTCAEGFRKCSSGICVLETLDCPVTKVKLDAGSISTESVTGEPPVISFAITPNDIPCFSDNYLASGPVASYELIDKEDGCSKYGLDDEYSFALGELRQKEIFDDNDFPKSVYNLPDYANVYKKTDSVLSYRRRLSVAEKDLCLNIETEILESPSGVTDDLNRFLNGTLIAALIIHGLLVSIVGIMIIILKFVKTPFGDILQGKGEKSMAWILLYFVFGVACYIDFVVMFASVVHFRAKMIVVSDYLKGLTDEGCFLDLQAQSAAIDYQIAVNDVAGNYFRFSLLIFLIGSFSMFSCGYLLWKVMKK